jgi:hypothetical protein
MYKKNRKFRNPFGKLWSSTSDISGDGGDRAVTIRSLAPWSAIMKGNRRVPQAGRQRSWAIRPRAHILGDGMLIGIFTDEHV